MKPQLAPIRGLGAAGLNTDVLDFDLPIQAVTTAKNVIFSEGNVRKGIGYSMLDIAELPEIDGNPERYEAIWFEGWVSRNNNVYLIVVGRDEIHHNEDRVFVYDAGANTWGDATSDLFPDLGTAYDLAGEWQTTIFGGTVVVNNGLDTPAYLDLGAEPLTLAYLPGWDDDWVAKVIRSYKDFLIALNMSEGGGSTETNAVRWSDAAGENSIPQTWVTATDNIAGKTFISSNDGIIVDGAQLNDSFMIYTDRSAHAMSFIGGTGIMTTRKVFQNGIYSRNATAAFDTYHLTVGRVGVYTTDGSRVNHVGKDRVDNDFYGLISADENTVDPYLIADQSQKIAAYLFPSAISQGKLDRALVYNWHTNTYSYQDYQSQAIPLEFIKADFSPIPGETVKWSNFDNTDPLTYPPADAGGDTWADFSGIKWSGFREDEVQAILIFLAEDGRFYQAGEQFWHRDGGAFEAQVIRTGIDLDDVYQGNTEGLKHIFRILPQIKGTGTVQFRFGTSMNPDIGYSWTSYIDYVIGTDYKVDVRLPGGRYLAYEIYSNDSDGFWQIGGMDLDARSEGHN